MKSIALSASYLALALIAAGMPAATAAPDIPSVGQIFVDAAGHAVGQNVAGRILAADGTIESFRAVAIGTTVFDAIHVDGFGGGQEIAGVGSPAVTIRGSNAIVSLHDNVHSALQIRASAPTTIRYHLAPAIHASLERSNVARLEGAEGYVGSLVAMGSARDALSLAEDAIVARASSGSEILFLAKAADVPDASYQSAIVDGLASGALAAQYVSELRGSAVVASEIAHDPFTLAQTSADPSGAAVVSEVSARAAHATLLAYDLGYEALPASSARDVAVYFDGLLAERAPEPGQVLASAQRASPAYFAWNDQGRTQVLVGFQGEGDHRILLSASAGASTEPQARAERAQANGSRVDGAFEAHANGKITGSFLTATVPEGAASILGFTSLSDRTEVFRNVTFGASADLRLAGPDAMSLRAPTADLTIVDDVDTTMMLQAHGATDASIVLGDGVSADTASRDIITLDGPHGPAGALVVRDGALALDVKGVVHARLSADGTLLYLHGAQDASILRAIADGRLAARVLAGLGPTAPVARALAYAHDAHVSVEPLTGGAVALVTDAPVLSLEARGSALVAKGAEDLRVTVEGAPVAAASSAQAVLDGTGSASYFAEAGADGALHVLLDTGAQSGAPVAIRVESVVREGARAASQRDAFGAFHLYDDGGAVGRFVTLHADRAAGAIGGLTLVATGKPLLSSLAAGHGAFTSVAGEGQPVLTLIDQDARVEVADSTNGFTRIVAMQATDAAMRVAPDLHTSVRNERVLEILDANDTPVASVVAIAGKLTAQGSDGIRARLDAGGSLLVRTHDGIESELSDAERSMMNDAIAARRVLGQVVVDDGAIAGTSYDDATITTSATRERVDVTIESATHAGRTLILSLDPKTIPGLARGDASILFDGHAIREASSYADVLDASDDAGQAEFFVLAGDSGASQVLLSIPHFSTHTVTLQDESRSGSSVWLYATIILGGIAIAESIVLARKARARKNDITNERRP